MRFVFRVDRMGSKVEVRGLAVGDERIYRFERPIREAVASKDLPLRIPRSTTEGGDTEDRSKLPDMLRGLFVSESAISCIYPLYP